MTEEGEALAKEKKFIFQEVSAKTGENIGTLFNKDIAELVSARYLSPQEVVAEDPGKDNSVNNNDSNRVIDLADRQTNPNKNKGCCK